jgi:hypothetical protein
MMTSYAFDLIRADGSIDTFDLGCFDNDVEALRHAGQALRASPLAFAVNVWCDGVRIGRLRRDVPAAAAA